MLPSQEALTGGRDLLISVVGGAHHRAGLDMAETHRQGLLLEPDEFLGPVVAHHLGMLLRRSEVLTDGQDVDVVGSHVSKHFEQLVLGLAKADHQPRLGDHLRLERLDVPEQRKAIGVDSLRPDPGVEARHGLGVVVEDVGSGLDHGAHGVEVALEIRCQHLDRGGRAAPPDGANGPGKDARPAVLQVVAVDRCDDRVLEPQLSDGFRHPRRLAQVELRGPARRHRAKPARARADVAEDHEGSGTAIPAVEDVGTAGFLADRVQPPALNDLLELLEVAALGHPDADPFRYRLESERLGDAHSRMLPGVHSPSPFLIALRNWPAIIPSMIWWSKLRHMFMMWRIAIASPTTTARLTIDSVVRMAACG